VQCVNRFAKLCRRTKNTTNVNETWFIKITNKYISACVNNTHTTQLLQDCHLPGP